MDLDKLRELLELIAEQDVTEFELEEEGLRLQIKKDSATAPVLPVGTQPEPATAPEPPTAVVETRPAPEEDTASGASDVEGLTIVASPMVGTFYRAAEPGAKAFTDKGERVSSGQILCIIEAMKLMNEIESEHNGEIVDIYVDNGQTVQYGDRLFAVRED